MTALLGGSVYWAAAAIHDQHYPLPAALFFALTYAFIRPMIGDTLTEVPSLAFACLSLALLYNAARSHRFADAAWGGSAAGAGVSIRAGAFFMLPFLIIWLGYVLGRQEIFLAHGNHLRAGFRCRFRRVQPPPAALDH